MIRKMVFVAVVVFLVLSIFSAKADAAVIRASENIKLVSSEKINENAYLASNEALIESRIDGDVIGVANKAVFDGELLEDVLWAGQLVEVAGVISGDVRLVGGVVTIKEKIGGDAVVVAGDIRLNDESKIDGDGIFVGNKIVIDGDLQGNATVVGKDVTVNGKISGDASVVASNSLTVASSARVEGDLSYRSRKRVSIGDDVVTGEIRHIPFDPGKAATTFSRTVYRAFGYSMLIGMLAVGIIFVALVPVRVLAVVQTAEQNFLKSVWRGLLVVMLTPVALVLLAITVAGFLLSVGGFLLYLLLILLSQVFAGIFLGAWLEKVFLSRQELSVSWINASVGIIILSVVGVVPVAGWIIKTVLFFALAGAIWKAIMGGFKLLTAKNA